MSFLSKLREELCALPLKKNCCRKAMLWGLLCGKGELVSAEEQLVSLALPREISAFAAACVREVIGKPPRESTHGKVQRLYFQSKSAAQYLSDLDGGELPPKCSECRAAFLRGVFLACGRADDPERSYRLEFIPNAFCRGRVQALLSDWLEGKFFISHRKDEVLFVVRDSNLVEDFLARVGANEATFHLINKKIEHQIKNEANRLANCEAKNIEKSVERASAQIEILSALRDRRLLSSLPPELEEVARLRLEYPEMSIAQLSLRMTTGISKSGMNHRLRRMMEHAKRLLQYSSEKK